jgi:hypothetical protein
MDANGGVFAISSCSFFIGEIPWMEFTSYIIISVESPGLMANSASEPGEFQWFDAKFPENWWLYHHGIPLYNPRIWLVKTFHGFDRFRNPAAMTASLMTPSLSSSRSTTWCPCSAAKCKAVAPPD